MHVGENLAHFRGKEDSSSLHQVFFTISLKTAGSQLKRLTSTGRHMELVKQVATASLKIFGITDNQCLLRITCIIIMNQIFVQEFCFSTMIECIANMHHMILIGRL
jgi:hypothetical protein